MAATAAVTAMKSGKSDKERENETSSERETGGTQAPRGIATCAFQAKSASRKRGEWELRSESECRENPEAHVLA